MIAATREAIVTGLDGVCRAYRYNPEELNTACAVVGFPTSYNPNDSQGNTATLSIPVSVYVPYGASRSAEEALETLVESVITAIEAIDGNYAVPVVRDFGVLENTAGVPTALGCVVEVLVFA